MTVPFCCVLIGLPLHRKRVWNEETSPEFSQKLPFSSPEPPGPLSRWRLGARTISVRERKCFCGNSCFVVTIYVLTNFIKNAIKSDRAFYQHHIRARTKTGLAVQVPVHDYKHSKGTLLVTMIPELQLYLILFVPHYKTINIWPQHN